MVLIPIAFYLACVGLLAFYGRSEEKNPFKYFFGSIADSLERLTGFQGWAMAGALTGLMALLSAAMGLYWDVAWHVDFGRDVGTLFTPAHVTILAGLGGLMFASAVSITFASLQEAPVKLRFGALRVPWGGLLFGVMGTLAVAAFPLDALWHKAYGLDVTLWSPTHLQLVTGGALGVFAVMVILAEALPYSKPNAFGRFWMVVAAGAVLTAVTTYQGEFDFRVPQFNPVYLPILIMAGAGIALTFSRLALGRWGAIKAVVAYLVIRLYLSYLVAGLHHEFAHFPLYLPSALMVELAAFAVGTKNRLKFGAVAGILIGTVGLVGEGIWIQASGWFGSAPQLLPMTLELAPLAAVAGAIIGSGAGRLFRRDTAKMPLVALGAAGAVLIAVLAIPLPRNVTPVTATIKSTPIGNGSTVHVAVQLQPANAADNALFFGISSWQGGGTKRVVLKETSPGNYTESAPVPVVGKWKSLVILVKGSINMAAPVYMPIDPLIHAPEIPAEPVRVAKMVRNTALLLREAHEGPAWPKQLGYAGLVLSTGLLIALIAAAAYDSDTDVETGEQMTGGGSGWNSFMKPYQSPQPATNGNGHGNGTWRPAPAPVPTWNPGGLSGVRRY
ncbi:MAG TPA: hypothetical protein VFW71_01775 [Actinomycetota bacterium]|nr:hypothetical protein [Actinomycetota bacterium]